MASTKSARSKKAHEDGISRELLAALLLRAKFYRILGQRLRTPFGEVDILAEKNGALIIVEVKSRTSERAAGEAISPHQQDRLLRAAEYLGARFKKSARIIRCDAFLFPQGKFPRHIKNAFQAG